MPWPRGSLLAALLILSVPLASADTITVNTTTDDNAVNTLCSLREAVEYFNRLKPAAGYQGCVAVAGQTDIITLASDAAHPYLLASAIYINKGWTQGVTQALTINGVAATGDTRTIIKATGSNRLFVFSDKPVFKPAACGLVTPTATCYAASVAGPLGPIDAPVLAVGSDTANTDDTTSDFLTDDTTPTFTGSISHLAATPDVTPPPVIDIDAGTTTTTTTTTSIKVRLYRDAKGTETAATELNSVVMPYNGGLPPSSLPAPSAWSLTVLSNYALPFGDQSIYSTTQKITTVTTVTQVGAAPSTTVVTNTLGTESAESPRTAIRVYPSLSNSTLTLNLLDLEGCAPLAADAAKDCSANADLTLPNITDATTGLVYNNSVVGTAGKGGIIFGTGNVVLNSVVLHGGHASASGGAVYIADKGSLDISLSEVRDNKADHGAAFYLAHNALTVTRTLITANKVIAAASTDAAVVEVNQDAGGGALIGTSTLSGNQGMALSLRDGSVVSSSTIVLNEGGINFNLKSSSVYNSIIAGNPDNFSSAAVEMDCTDLPTTPNVENSVSVTGGGCALVSDVTKVNLLANKSSGPVIEKLMAGVDSNGNCAGYSGLPATFKGMGILCLLADNTGATRTHLIRLLPSYTQVSDSPLMTKGPAVGIVCESTDQRAKERHSPCDIGALELQPVTAAASSGGTISYGQTYTSDVYSTGDEELFDPLFDASKPCPSQTLSADNTKLGCPWLETAPSRGTVVFNANGTYTYTPNGNFHGFDRFTMRVVTTLSRLNTDSGTQGQSRLITAQVIVEPTSGISSSSLGAFDEGLILLGGLLSLVRRRYKQGAK